MRRAILRGTIALAAMTVPLFAGVTGFGISTYESNGKSLRIYKVTDTRVDTAYDLTTRGDPSAYWSGVAVNAHGTHVAYWRRTREFSDSTYTTTDWRNVIAEQDDAALFLLGVSYRSVTETATLTGCTQARAQQLKAVVDSINRLGSSELWAMHILRAKQPNDWNFDLSFEASTGRWSKKVRRTVPEFRLTLMRIDNPLKTADLVVTGRDLAGFPAYEGPGSIAWPQGDWIYFNTFGRGMRFFYRVNVQTRAIEFVTVLEENWRYIYPGSPCCYTTVEFRMSTYARQFIIGNAGLYTTFDELKAQGGMAIHKNWTDGGMFPLGGCGFTLSPSGKYAGNQYDPGHTIYVINTLDWVQKRVTSSVLYKAEDRNLWSVDRTDPQLACDIAWGFTESVGVGHETVGHNYAVNSDRWVCMRSGWAPSGRDGGNGMNFILYNFQDSVALNVSRGPRTGNVEPQCHKQSTRVWVNDPVFFVTAPQSDIIPELQADATRNYTVAGLDDNTNFSAPTMMPLTPYNGSSTSALPPRSVGGRKASGSHRSAAVVVKGGIAQIRVPGRGTVEIFDARGASIIRADGNTHVRVSTAALPGGLYRVRITCNGQTFHSGLVIGR